MAANEHPFPTATRGRRKLHVKSYGCQMNVYDSHRMADTLAREGFIESAAEDADLRTPADGRWRLAEAVVRPDNRGRSYRPVESRPRLVFARPDQPAHEPQRHN